MADHWVTGWKMSDFDGALSDPEQADVMTGDVFVGTTATLRRDAALVRFRVSDEDDRFQGAFRDTGDLATPTDALELDGMCFAAGHSRIEAAFELQTDDLPPATLVIGRVATRASDPGINLLVFSDTVLVPGRCYRFANCCDAAAIRNDAICFASGTQIDTPEGSVAIERLTAGDHVLTRDSGPQRVVWVGHRALSARDLRIAPRLAPIRIRAGALGNNRPERDLVLSPQHHLEMSGVAPCGELGVRSVLVPAKALCNDRDVTIDTACRGVTYWHLLLERHELVRANGQWAESLLPGNQAAATLCDDQRIELDWISPGALANAAPPVRPILTVVEARGLNV